MSITTTPSGGALTGPRTLPPMTAPAQPARPRTSGPVMLGIGSIVLFLGGFAAWSTLAPLAEAAIAPGQIRSEGNRRTIQHLEGGIVREILARDGDKVQAGQVLMRLDEVQSASGLEALRSQYWALLAQDARLQAEASGAR